MKSIRLRGARTHNLKNVDLELKPGTLIGLTGPSGSGKSSLAFETLYAEGQRRYVESFSAYARQFLERMARPDMDELDPVAAGVAVDQRAPARTSRSTVGTMTEVADYSKSLWSKASVLHCRQCGEKVLRQSPTSIASELLASSSGCRAEILARVPVFSVEDYLALRERFLAAGYRRVKVGEKVFDFDEVSPSDLGVLISDGVSEGMGEVAYTSAKKKIVAKKKVAKKTAKKKASKKATEKRAASEAQAFAYVLADRLTLQESDRARLVESLTQAFARGDGLVSVDVHRDSAVERKIFARDLRCANCDITYRDPTEGMFSFNHALGACPTCRGFGRVIGVDWGKVFPKSDLSLKDGAIAPWRGKGTMWERKYLQKHAALANVPMDVPFGKLTEAQRAWVIEGTGETWPRGWPGVAGWFRYMESRAYKMHVRVLLSRYRSYETCPDCLGARLQPESLLYKIGTLSIAQFLDLPASSALDHLRKHAAAMPQDPATDLLRSEVDRRLDTLGKVGLPYLSLSRASRTLSGGEAQRVALTSALSATLTSSLFVLDEPTAGLHPSDTEKLLGVMDQLCENDNVAIVIEHEPRVLARVDRLIALGPAAGVDGGSVVFDGDPQSHPSLVGSIERTGKLDSQAMANSDGGDLFAPLRFERVRRSPTVWTHLRGASGNNLKNTDLSIPVNLFSVITGVSGSGKSSLALETLVPAVQTLLGEKCEEAPLPYASLEGGERFSKVLFVDQSPVARTSRGNAATYLGVWDLVRKRFAKEPLAKEREYTEGTFSFNIDGGRCEVCKGDGAETVEMQFLADVTFSCPECGGKRFRGPVLDVKVHGLSCADVLDLTANQACEVFADDTKLQKRLKAMVELGVGYLKLGQSLNTLSGGEAQRLKLAETLSTSVEGALIVLDEPTVGLSGSDLVPLLRCLDRLVSNGNTVVVVEHDMRFAAFADWVIDVGPGAGAEGGSVVAEGVPEVVATNPLSKTGPYLQAELERLLPPAKNSAAKNQAKPKVSLHVERRAAKVSKKGDACIEVHDAYEHNLKHLDVQIPRERLTVVTGPSGSGKSTLAFDVVFAEGQRRFLETLSPYARQYMPQLPRPHVGSVVGVPPTVALEQRISRGGSNSTVATVTEIAQYLRLLFAKAGTLHCPQCKVEIRERSLASIADEISERVVAATKKNSKAEPLLLVPVVRGKKGSHREILSQGMRDGFSSARIDGAMTELKAQMTLSRFDEHNVDLAEPIEGSKASEILARLKAHEKRGEGAFRLLIGKPQAGDAKTPSEWVFSTKRSCGSCGKGFPELDPRFFSFNTKQGQCPSCEGRGLLVREQKTKEGTVEVVETCGTCEGTRLSELARAVTLQGQRIETLMSLTIEDMRKALEGFAFEGRTGEIAKTPLYEAKRRLDFLEAVGVSYLHLHRNADTLSGGEMQRVRLAAQLGAGLTGLLYVLDEPTIGLHPRDTGKLIDAMRGLVERGNTVLVVEHDSDVIRAADHILDIGPSGGKAGGHLLASGTPGEVIANLNSFTGNALREELQILPQKPSLGDAGWLRVFGASGHNLKNVDVQIPYESLSVITGVSGSGKSTLARRILLPAVRDKLGLVNDRPAMAYKRLEGAEHFGRAVWVDQSPIGRTPRSVPATYMGIWDELRKVFAATPDARARGFGPSSFSFNVSHDGRCPTCDGNGIRTIEMAFLPDVHVECETCGGRRFTREIEAVKLHGLSPGELLLLPASEALPLLSAFDKIKRPLSLLVELGLGYLTLGQPSHTLSGGEAQRLKLVAELSAGGSRFEAEAAPSGKKTSKKGIRYHRTLYVLDEPTTGLHRADVARLLRVLRKFTERGDTVLLVEHHLDVMAQADWLVDLGPEGGVRGGNLVAAGTPTQIADNPASETGRYLRTEFLPQKTKPRARSATKRGRGEDAESST